MMKFGITCISEVIDQETFNQKLNNRMNMKKLIACLCIFAGTLGVATAQDLDSFNDRVTEFTLDNGLTFIVIERDVAPVASFMTFVDVGSANEPVGQTGIAHIFEHMAFKGTERIGTTNYEEEKPWIDKLDEAYLAWLDEYNNPNADEDEVERLWEEFEEIQEQAHEYVESEEYTNLIESEGGTGMNAFTSADGTGYFYSLPANKMELWFNLESDRFMNPVMREFYVEKDVIKEERRSRTDSDPIGRLVEEFTSVAFSAHTYKNPVIGWPSDIRNTTIQDAWDFYDKYYVPSNITMAVSGNVDPDEVKELAEKYFSHMPGADREAPKLRVEEPEQRGERRFTIQDRAQPVMLMGYHTVDANHPDALALETLGNVLAQGRTSRMYQELVVEERTAMVINAFNGYPGDKYAGLFMILGLPNQGVDMEDLEEGILEEIEKIKDGDLEQEEIDRVVSRERAQLTRSLRNNSGMAQQFAMAHARYGSWESVFNRLDEMDALTVDDLQRVAEQYFIDNNRTVGTIETAN